MADQRSTSSSTRWVSTFARSATKHSAASGSALHTATSGSEHWTNKPSGAGFPKNLTINSTTVAPKFYYLGTGFTEAADDWVPLVGSNTLTTAGSGTEPSIGTSNPSVYQGVKYNDGEYHENSSADFDLGTGDFVLEAFVQIDHGGANDGIFGKLDGSNNGWNAVVLKGLGAVRMNISTTANPFQGFDIGGCTIDSFRHLMWFVNRDEASTNGARGYRDGTQISSKDYSVFSGTNITSTSNFVCGTRANNIGGDLYNKEVIAMGMWCLDDWFASGTGSHSEWDTIASERASLFGV